MRKRPFLLLFLSFFLTFHCVSQITVEGIVFVDKNKDGIYQRGEKLLKNILVSNGDTIVKTDKKGKFSISSTHNNSIFPILPGNYTFNSQGIISRQFLNIQSSENSQTLKHNFALMPANNAINFRVDVVGDVQVKDMQELHYAQQTILSELIRNGEKEFVVFMGDLSNDSDDMLLKISNSIQTLPFESWNVIGNHDLTETKPRTTTLFNELFGSDVFAFFRGKACFIGLNNSTGNFTKSQIRFVTQLIQLLPDNVLPVFFEHIPLQNVSNREEILNAIGCKKSLILAGHEHIVRRQTWNENINEWVVGASCGSWWVGEKDYCGIPIAIQQCGSPRNYFQLFIDGNDYQLKFKAVDSDQQMHVWIKGDDVMDDSIPVLAKLPPYTVIANIFAGGDSTKVEYSLNGSDWLPMTKAEMVDPNNSRIIEWNKRKIYPTQYSKRLPLRNRNSPHIWTCMLPELSPGSQIIKIRATDNYGLLPIEQSRLFYVTE